MTGRNWLFAGAFVVAGALAPLASSSAASLTPQSGSRMTEVEGGTLVQKTASYCRGVHYECGQRFGWRTRDFYRCIARRGC